MPPKIIWMGKSVFEKEQLSPGVLSFFEVVQLPHQFPANMLDYLGDISMLVINHSPDDGEDGLQALNNIRLNSPQKIRNVEVLLLAKESQKDNIISAFRGDFFDFLFWPFEEEALTQRMERHLGKMVAKDPAQSKKNWSFSEMFSHFLPSASLGFAPALTHSKIQPVEQKNTLRLQFFGPFEIFYEGRQIPCDLPRKPKLLLSHILYNHPKPVLREQLMDWLWPDVDGDSARNSLNNAAFHIRRWLDQYGPGGNILLLKDNFYQLKSGLNIESDAALFANYLRQARQLEFEGKWLEAVDFYHKAFAFYRGRFLEEWQDDNWVTKESDRYKEQYLLALDKLSQKYFEEGQLEPAIAIAQRQLDADPLQEEAHRRLMRCYGQLGQRDRALKQFEQCKSALGKYLHTGPSSQTMQLLVQINQQSR